MDTVMPKTTKFAACVLAAGLAMGCATAESREELAERRLAEIEVRQGERVDRVCFTRSIDGFRDFGPKDLLIREGVNDWYRLELSGTCQPDQVFTSIGLRTSPGSTCLRRGDDVLTRDGGFPGRCFITAIYEWDEDAEFTWPPEEDEAQEPTSDDDEI